MYANIMILTTEVPCASQGKKDQLISQKLLLRNFKISLFW